MRKEEFKEGLGDLAHAAELDHEVQMARSDLYKLAKYAIKLHDMLKGVSEQEGLEGWVQAKITKSAADIGSVYHNLDYKLNFEEKNKPEELALENSYKKNLEKRLQEKKAGDPCWKNYKMVGMKKKNGKKVPNCVPK